MSTYIPPKQPNDKTKVLSASNTQELSDKIKFYLNEGWSIYEFNGDEIVAKLYKPQTPQRLDD